MTTSLLFCIGTYRASFIVAEPWAKIPSNIQRFVSMAFDDIGPCSLVFKDRWGLTDHKFARISSLRDVEDWLSEVRT